MTDTDTDIAVPELAGCVYYGVHVREVPDGDDYIAALVAVGHPPARRVLAAFAAHARQGKWLLCDELPDLPLADQLQRCWAVIDPHGIPTYDGLPPIRWDASPLDAGSFPVTVLEPTIPDEQETPA